MTHNTKQYFKASAISFVMFLIIFYGSFYVGPVVCSINELSWYYVPTVILFFASSLLGGFFTLGLGICTFREAMSEVIE